jgi:transaldolase
LSREESPRRLTRGIIIFNASLSCDTAKTIEEALKIIEIYKQKGIDKSRVLIKIASTWEGKNGFNSDRDSSGEGA